MPTVPFRRYKAPDLSDLTKRLPSNLDAERYVLSAILVDSGIPNSILKIVQETLGEADFFFDQNRVIFRNMLFLQDTGQPIEVLPLIENLERNGELEKAGGSPYLGALLQEGIRSCNAAYYCGLIREKAQRRNLIHITHAIQERAFENEQTAEKIIADASEMFSRLQKPTQENPAVVVGSREMLTLQLPDPEWLLEPLLTRAGTAMLYSWAGWGKSWIATEMAFRFAIGSKTIFEGHHGVGGHWPINGPVRTLYLYGEMHGAKIRERLIAIGKGHRGEIPEDEFLGVMSKDYQKIPRAPRVAHTWRPSICTPKDRDYVEQRLFGGGYELLILDNISTLWSAAQEDQSRQVSILKDWFIDLNMRGITVLVLQHAGKSGDFLGDSAQIHILDSVLKLLHPPDYKKSEGLRVILEIQKNRYECRDPHWLMQFETSLRVTPDAGAQWFTRPAREAQMIAAFSAFRDGMPTMHVAQEVGVSKATIYRWKKKFDENPDAKQWAEHED
jgi:DnaB-like helicase N terminal domain/AAA domain/Homeodomain-like domain